ncbi:MAG TPA: hypothetical protein VHE35_01070 [Kofleriaceae bacterium]|nr:hypothetical protein [Kofleriaceae bacterium]
MTTRTRQILGCVLVAGLALVGACGGGDDTDAWLGNWSAAGTQSTTCGASTTTSQVTGVVIISAGPDDGSIQTLLDNCTLLWDVSGTRATLRSGQLCTVTVAGSNVTVTWTQSTATIDGSTIMANNTGATNNGCSFMQQATLTKM